MAELNGPGIKRRVVDRVGRVVLGDRIERLQHRLETLEAEVQECRRLNIRIAELTDVVEQLLLPIASQDQERIAVAVEKYSKTV
jgi:hypothetical protein